ncbi:hypothetical protein ES703_105447 [subsurface metagenome]
MADATTVDVSDGTLHSEDSEDYDLDLTVTPAVGDGPNSSISNVTPAPATTGIAVTITVTTYDDYLNPRTSGGDTVVINVTGSNSATPGVNDVGDGTYTGDYIPTASGTDNITGTINAVAIGRDAEGASDGTYNLTVNPAEASYLKVTGSSTIAAGGSEELTITAYDANDNVATGYEGLKPLTFSGPGNAPDGTVPTVEGTNIGTAVDVNFIAGVSDTDAATLVAYKAESISVDVDDGAINSGADPDYDYDLEVLPATTGIDAEFTQQPGGASAGVVWAQQPMVRLHDPYGNTVHTDDSTEISLAINTNPGGGTLGGTTAVAVQDGVATFTDLSIDKVGLGYDLVASGTGFSSVFSASFDINGIISGTLLYNSAAITSQTNEPASFWVRDEGTGQAVPVTPSYSTTSGVYSIPDLPPGQYAINPKIDAALPQDGQYYPGDFIGSQSPIVLSVGDSTVNQDIECQIIMHVIGRDGLSTKLDNSNSVTMPPPFDEYQSPVDIDWDAVPGATSYELRLNKFQTSPFQFIENVASISGITDTQYTLPLILNGANDHYRLTLYAYNGTRIGLMTVVYSSGGWAPFYDFRVTSTADVTPPTVTSFNPADDAMGVAVDASLVINFNVVINCIKVISTVWIAKPVCS